jgi:cellulose synthase/poly-beta-1,6-N-acetylglucosamine synthase-like glycosyltransferase
VTGWRRLKHHVLGPGARGVDRLPPVGGPRHVSATCRLRPMRSLHVAAAREAPESIPPRAFFSFLFFFLFSFSSFFLFFFFPFFLFSFFSFFLFSFFSFFLFSFSVLGFPPFLAFFPGNTESIFFLKTKQKKKGPLFESRKRIVYCF